MKKVLAGLVIALSLPLLGAMIGCGPSGYQGNPPRFGEPMSMAPDDRRMQIRRFAYLECRQIVEDWDYLWLQDEPSKLTPWYMPDRE